jgi:hypothetical protein
LGDDGAIELAGGALDDPDVAPPTVQYVLKDKLALFDSLRDVPHQPHVEKEAALNARVVAYQHPDHDTDLWAPHPSTASS